MKYLIIVACLVVTLAVGIFVLRPSETRNTVEKKTKPQPNAVASEITESFLADHRGKVLVLLMGMESCPETKRMTPLLESFRKSQSDDVAVARVDVPPPGESLQPRGDWPYTYSYELDHNSVLARQLEFFYYPTLYVIDRDGEVRYAGGYEAEKLGSMVTAIVSEPRGLANKTMYTPPLPAVGTQAPDFVCMDIMGEKRELSSLLGKKATLLFFGSTSCPFSVKALADLRNLAATLGKDGLSVVVINKKEPADSVRKVYEAEEPNVPVVLDANGAICETYGVKPVPFQFVLDSRGIITQRGPFTAANATNALTPLLGSSVSGCASEASGAG
jgi:peroxiredoxin